MAPLMPEPVCIGHPRNVEFCEVINVVRYPGRLSCSGHTLPIISTADIRSVAGSANWRSGSCLPTIDDVELMLDRKRARREASLIAAVILNAIRERWPWEKHR